MKILIDDANIDAIKALYPVYPIDGVTTNPSILAKSGRQPYEVLKEIRAFIGADGIATAKIIQDMFTKNGLHCNILAASFKNSQQVQALAQYGVGAATIAPAVIEGLVRNAAVAAAIDDFTRDFESLCGKGVTMKDAK